MNSASGAAIPNEEETKSKHHGKNPAGELGDFTTTWRVLPICVMAFFIGLVGTASAWVLLRLIGLVTNLFFYQRWDFAMTSPAHNQLGWLVILAPIIGGLIVGLMARYGSDKIRGHGIPEAIESILMSGSRVEPKLAILKPISAAVAIGSGGPFGAEGPIIMTGGAFGSLIAQFFHLTSAERKTLLVAGAAAGMSATFAAPLSSTLLGIELLLFEWKPRSAIPVAIAALTAGVCRRYVLGMGPLFPVPAHAAFIGVDGVLGCVLAGILGAIVAGILSRAIYAVEDGFTKLPIHWMWWPAMGAVVVGVGGYIFPPALGVGYDVIGRLLQGNVPLYLIVGVLCVKSVVWVASLGSGTSGGVLAPLLMMGAALGAVESMFLPHYGLGFWELVSMGAVLSGTIGAPLTAAVFAVELTHDINMVLPLTITCFMAYLVTVLTMKRSILTEKIARRGYHLSREYAVDPLEILFVKEVMRTNLVALPATDTLTSVRELMVHRNGTRGQEIYPVVDKDRRLVGVINRDLLQKVLSESSPEDMNKTVAEIASKSPIIAYPEEPLRVVVYRMVESGLTRFPVVDPWDHRKLLGIVSLEHLLQARSRNLTEERARERVLRIRFPLGGESKEKISA
jgi:H+/Cl- antiporter ClcA/predicted transcriptional regulator